MTIEARYIDAEKLKRQLLIADDDTSKDSFLQDLIEPVESALDQIISPRLILRAERTEVHNGSDDAELCLNCYPIVSITSIKLSSSRDFGSGTTPVDATGYSFDAESGIVTRTRGGRWPSDAVGVQVVYVGGYEATPPVLERALRIEIAEQYMRDSRLQSGQEQAALTGHSFAGVESENYASEFDEQWGMTKRTVAAIRTFAPNLVG